MRKISLLLGLAIMLAAATGFDWAQAKGQPNVDGIVDTIKFVEVGGEEIGVLKKDFQAEAAVDQADSHVKLPSYYNSYKEGYVTYVKDQGYTDNCWAYACMNALESSMLRMGLADKKDLRLSERQMAYFTYRPRGIRRWESMMAGGDRFRMFGENGPYYEGGTRDAYVSTLARRAGASDNTELSNYWNMPRWAYYRSDVHLDRALYLPDVANTDLKKKKGKYVIEYLGIDKLSRDILKKHIMDYGAANISYAADEDFYDDDHSSHYVNKSGKDWLFADHEVSVVGWDDKFSRKKFAKKPKHDGAWIIKNTWGKGEGDKGFIYLSYWDTSIIEPTVLIPANEKYKKGKTDHRTDSMYQYDGVRFGDGMLASKKPVEGANIFETRNRTAIRSLGVSTFNPYTRVTLVVNKGVKKGDPTSGQEVFSKQLVYKYPGYYTVYLPKGVKLKAGERFSVRCMQQSKTGKWFYLPLESQEIYDSPGDSNLIIDVRKGQTYYRFGSLLKSDKQVQAQAVSESGVDFSAWKDIYGSYACQGQYKLGNAVVKAMGKNY